jgi:hypothetical protein
MDEVHTHAVEKGAFERGLSHEGSFGTGVRQANLPDRQVA